MAQLDTVTQQSLRSPSEPSPEPAAPPPPAQPDVRSWGWSTEPIETREVRKARERADRAARRAGRAARRLHEAQARAARHESNARQLIDAAGDAATAALTAVSVAADEAHARLAAKARMRELEHAVITARAGGAVDVSPPTRDEALKLARRVDPGSSGSVVRGVGFIAAGITALAMMLIGGFGWLGFVVPLVILVASGSLEEAFQSADRNRKASQIQVELARASLAPGEPASGGALGREAQGAPAAAASASSARPRLIEGGDPRTGAEVMAVLDRLIANVRGLVAETDMATLGRIRESARLVLLTQDGPLDLADHDTWLARQICIDYLPGALEHFIALPSGRASEPLLDGRSARQVLDEQLALIESRLGELATRSYRREADGLLIHARFLADSLRPDPFRARLDELAGHEPAAELVAAAEPVPVEVSMTASEPAARTRERA